MLAVTQIDQALKRLYNLETTHCAEDFLLASPPDVHLKKVASKDLQGALYIYSDDSEKIIKEQTVDLGIYLSKGVAEELKTFATWQNPWEIDQVKAFTVATEEVSHFHYLIYNLQRERRVSQFELELQGEIDKFLMLFFCKSLSKEKGRLRFEDVFRQLFSNYQLASHLSQEEKQRYLDASTYAKRFIRKMKTLLGADLTIHQVLKQTRLFYRMDLAYKMAFLH
ncbi:MAG: hypothetical protein EXR74_03275 [Bdellovibrionales bacterium]|nr:hypothetical protein [Bdellovibrionales bacterium]